MLTLDDSIAVVNTREVTWSITKTIHNHSPTEMSVDLNTTRPLVEEGRKKVPGGITVGLGPICTCFLSPSRVKLPSPNFPSSSPLISRLLPF